MRRNIIIIALLFLLALPGFSQSSIEAILQHIEQNNKELQANQYLTESKKLEDKTDNNLPNPSVEYEHMIGSPTELGKSGELTVSQEFDFPTVYVGRNKLNKLKAQSYDRQYDLTRRDILLQAKEICLDLVLLNQQKAVLKNLYDNADELSRIYQRRLETGDANILEVNKIRMEFVNMQTEILNNEAQRQAKLQELIAMNGNIPLEFNDTGYTPVPEPHSFLAFKEEYLASDVQLQSLQSEFEASQREISVNKSGWLPKLQVGYRHDKGEGEQFNGFMVGASIPLFENRNKVKAARAKSAYTELQKKSVQDQAEANLQALYNELQQLKGLMNSYNLDLLDTSMELLKQALDARQISLTNYFTEIATIYENRQGYMQLENRYQKIMAQLYKNSL